MADNLGGFAVPEHIRARFLTAWRRDKSRDVDVVATRRRLGATRERVKELFLSGDIDRAEYQTRKAKFAEELAILPSTSDPESEVGPLLMGFLANVSNAWNLATPEERSRLARQLFGQVVITNRTAVAVVPRPDLRPIFEVVTTKSSDAHPEESG